MGCNNNRVFGAMDRQRNGFRDDNFVLGAEDFRNRGFFSWGFCGCERREERVRPIRDEREFVTICRPCCRD